MQPFFMPSWAHPAFSEEDHLNHFLVLPGTRGALPPTVPLNSHMHRSLLFHFQSYYLGSMKTKENSPTVIVYMGIQRRHVPLLWFLNHSLDSQSFLCHMLSRPFPTGPIPVQICMKHCPFGQLRWENMYFSRQSVCTHSGSVLCNHVENMVEKIKDFSQVLSILSPGAHDCVVLDFLLLTKMAVLPVY